MAYARSLARQDFERASTAILAVCRKSAYKKAGVPSPAIDMLLQAAIFKTSALLEEYLKDSISDWLHQATTKGHTAGSLPNELRWFCVSAAHASEYGRYVFQADESRLIARLSQKPENALLNPTVPLAGLLLPVKIFGNRKYPSVKNIKALFSRIGVPNIFDRVNARGKRPFDTAIESFLDVREAIAHQSPPSLTMVDVQRLVGDVQEFVSMLDRELASHVRSIHGTGCWRTG